MALYAFDGTWNEDDEIEDIYSSKDTNVRNFVEAYVGKVEYVSGISTRYGILGRLLGGIFGAGGKTRIDEMYERFWNNFKAGDKTVDIIGFSRGAALAVHFANHLAQHGIVHNNAIEYPVIRFLGLWDMVRTIGLPSNFSVDFQKINLGYDLTLSKSVEHCYHALAIDERRDCFKETRLNQKGQPPVAREVWFKGVHGDVGGGAMNPGLENISLYWMFQNAMSCGLELNQAHVDRAKNAIDEKATISSNADIRVGPRREVRVEDIVHESVIRRVSEIIARSVRELDQIA